MTIQFGPVTSAWWTPPDAPPVNLLPFISLCTHNRAMPITTLSDPAPLWWCPDCSARWSDLQP